MKNKIILPAILPLLATQVSAISIALDFDTHSSTFFDDPTNGSAARAAVQAAADDISAAITTNLSALPTTRIFTGFSSGGAAVELTTRYLYSNPNTGAATTYTGSLASNEIKIFVGARSLSSSILGQASLSSGFIPSASVGGPTSDAQNAADIASSNASLITSRGGAIIQTTSDGEFAGSYPGTTYTADFAPALGNLWFDNDGSTTWHFDHTTTPVGSDLYSVALHEILHSLGIGASDSWNDNVSGTTWLGAEAIASHGTGTGLLYTEPDGGHAHIAENIMSARLSDGVLQDVVMDPNITNSTRKELTELDLAFLRDIGWQTVPEPSSTLLLGLGSLTLIMRRRK